MPGYNFSIQCIDHEIQVNPSFVIPKLYTNPEVEQVVVLLLLGHDILKSSSIFIGKIQVKTKWLLGQAWLPEVEQVVVLLLLGHDILKSSGIFIGKIQVKTKWLLGQAWLHLHTQYSIFCRIAKQFRLMDWWCPSVCLSVRLSVNILVNLCV